LATISLQHKINKSVHLTAWHDDTIGLWQIINNNKSEQMLMRRATASVLPPRELVFSGQL